MAVTSWIDTLPTRRSHDGRGLWALLEQARQSLVDFWNDDGYNAAPEHGEASREWMLERRR